MYYNFNNYYTILDIHKIYKNILYAMNLKIYINIYV